MTRKLKNLKTNKVAITVMRAQLKSVLNEITKLKYKIGKSCTMFIKHINHILNLIKEDPSSGKISNVIFTIAASNFVCNSMDKQSLSSLTSSLTAAESAIVQDETSVQETLTGNTNQ